MNPLRRNVLCRSSVSAGFAGLALAAAAVAAPPPPALQPADVFALQWAENPVLAPDGKSLVYQRTFFDVMKDQRRSNLWLVDVGSGASRPLTTGNVNDGQAAWSPDGKRIAYVAADGEKPQIFVRWLDSGATAKITQLPQGPSNLAWSPDGKWIAYTMLVSDAAKPFAELPPAPEGAQWAKPPKVLTRLTYRFDGAGYLEPGFTHLFVVPAEGGAARQVTHGERNYDGVPAWLPDGKSVIVSTNLDPDWEYQPLESELYRIDVASGEAKRLTDRRGPDQAPALSPDGKLVAYIGFTDKKLGYQNSELSVLDLASGKSRVLTADFDFGVDSPAWDGNRGIYFHYDQRGEDKIGWVAVGGGKVETVAADFGGTGIGRPYGGGSMSGAAGHVAYTRGTITRPADVAVVAHGAKSRVLTHLADSLLDARTLGRVEDVEVKSSADQRAIQGWIVYPPDFDAKKKYPLLLEIHGGPFANYGPRFAPETQLYAAAGYVVLYMNPRGSTSYGAEFANLIHHNYPSQDYDDLMSGVDAVIARGFVDTKNLFVTGGSGGGVLTAWIVGHTDRFRAAVVAKPVINWYSFVLTSDAYPFFADYWFPAKPWENAEHYLKRSPISYVGNVKTPTMLIVGESDHRTPISEAEQYYQALKLRHIDTALVRLPGASHEINRRPSQMLTQVLYTSAWFEKHKAAP